MNVAAHKLQRQGLRGLCFSILVACSLTAIALTVAGSEMGSRSSVPNSVEEASAQQVTVSGWFHMIWGDGPPGSRVAPEPLYVLTDDSGQWFRIILDGTELPPPGDLLALNGKRVVVEGERIPTATGLAVATADRVIQARSIRFELVEDAEAAALPMPAVVGSQPWVSILCRFADSTNVTPKPASYFNGLMSSSYPGLDHYWQEVSYGNINLSGSMVFGWYNLPQPRSYYVYDRNGDGIDDADLVRLAQDCTSVADAAVYFPDFVGVNLMFNDRLGCCAHGGRFGLNLDGQTRTYRMTWLPPWGYQSQSVLAHETGHGFGLPHSSGRYGATYDSSWDVMSNAWVCSPLDPVYGCLGQHTISYHKDLLGWIPLPRKYMAEPETTQTITIERLAQPISSSNYLMAEVMFIRSAEGFGAFYTVETRRFAGYDGQIPGEAIVIHEVYLDHGRGRAFVVDATNDGDPNDAGAMWTVGETFSDSVNGITVSVDSSNTSSFTVTIVGRKNDPPAVISESVTTPEDIPLTITLTGTDPDGDGLTFAIETGPSNGSLSAINPLSPVSAEVTYTPNTDFNGSDSFTFKTNDGTADSNPATVSIAVNAVNDASVAQEDAFSVEEDNTLNVAAPGVLANDTDVDGDSLTAILISGPSNGSLTLNSDGSFTYVPNADFNGIDGDSFTYKANDGTADSNEATATLTINPVNDAPVADAGPVQSVSGTSAEGASVTLDGSASSDVEGDTLTYTWAGPFPEGGGTVTGVNSTVTMPLGPSTVELVVNDGTEDSAAPDQVSITVTDFAVSSSPGDATVSAGQSANYTITVSPQYGSYDSAVALTCAGLPSKATCSFSPSSVTPGGSDATSTLTISTTAASSVVLYPTVPVPGPPPLWIFSLVAAMGLLAAVYFVRRPVGRFARVRVAVSLAALLCVLQIGCGGGGSPPRQPIPGTPAGTHSITVTGTAGSLSNTTTVKLTVQ